MDFTETEIVEERLRYGNCAYSERNDINTDHLFIESLKKLKKERKKKNLHVPGVDRGSYPMRTCLLPAVLSDHNPSKTEPGGRGEHVRFG